MDRQQAQKEKDKMRTLIFLLIIILSICSSNTIYGQSNKLDSLFNELKTAKADTTKIRIRIKIGEEAMI